MTLSKADLIASLPKAELHMHIEGSLEPEMLFGFAERNGVKLAYDDLDALRAAYEFDCLQDFLNIYYAGMSVLMTEQDYFELALAYFERAAADNVRHAEIFFDPQGHTQRGVPFGVVADGLLAGMAEADKRLGVTSDLILCFLRDLPEESAFETLAQAEPWLDRITGVGLDSAEQGHPPGKFQRVFEKAGALGLKRVAHAGEEGPPEYVRDAIDLLEIDRLDHGNRSMEDAELVVELARSAMTFTVCPLSNYCLGGVKSLSAHPIAEMFRSGLRVTINSDDPAYFGGYVNANYLAVADLLTPDEIIQIARNSFLGSFLDTAATVKHLKAVDAVAAAHRPV